MMRLRGFSEELDGELDGFRKNKLRLVSFDTIFGAIPTCLSLSADSMLLAL